MWFTCDVSVSIIGQVFLLDAKSLHHEANFSGDFGREVVCHRNYDVKYFCKLLIKSLYIGRFCVAAFCTLTRVGLSLKLRQESLREEINNGRACVSRPHSWRNLV